jgi:hypothetical protein
MVVVIDFSGVLDCAKQGCNSAAPVAYSTPLCIRWYRYGPKCVWEGG